MPSPRTGLELIVARPIGRGIFITVIDRFLHAFARIIRIRKDRALLDEMPDYLLRDIGISRSDISSATRFGGQDLCGGLWI